MRGLFDCCVKLFRSNLWYRVLVGITLLAVLCFFVLHAGHILAGTRYDIGHVLLDAGLKSKDYNLWIDYSYAEWFEYVMLTLVVINLGRLALAFHQSVYLALVFVFAFCLLDNSLRIHEELGAFLSGRLAIPPSFGLRAKDLGELLTWAILGMPLVGFLCYGLLRSEGRHRSVGRALTGLFFVLVLFAIPMDMLSILSLGHFVLAPLVGSLEDAGEMAVIAVIMVLTFAIPTYLRTPDERESEGRHTALVGGHTETETAR